MNWKGTAKGKAEIEETGFSYRGSNSSTMADWEVKSRIE